MGNPIVLLCYSVQVQGAVYHTLHLHVVGAGGGQQLRLCRSQHSNTQQAMLRTSEFMGMYCTQPPLSAQYWVSLLTASWKVGACCAGT